jgi:hypothetical protein
VADLARTSVRASFAPPELKAEIMADIDAYLIATTPATTGAVDATTGMADVA